LIIIHYTDEEDFAEDFMRYCVGRTYETHASMPDIIEAFKKAALNPIDTDSQGQVKIPKGV
jgi:hypothetical protein